jgi:hypothetical protein
MTTQNIKLKWNKSEEEGYTDIGVDKAPIYQAVYKDYYIEVYPAKLYNADADGWYYRIIQGDKEYDVAVESCCGKDDNYKDAMANAEYTLLEIVEDGW